MLLHSNSSSHSDLWYRNLGSDPGHWTTAGGIPPQVGEVDLRETVIALGGRELGITPTGGGYTGGMLGGYGDLHI